MYRLIKTEGRAKRGEFRTPHGVIQTPVFMNVATCGAIKGGLSAGDLRGIGTQVALSNTYHLHLRPGDGLVRQMGGLRRFMAWDGPVLTDSGGFQIYSLAKLRKIREDGAYFSSHIDGRNIFMGPEESVQIQSNLGSTIAMAFDECPPIPATREYVQASVDRTYRWLLRCADKLLELKGAADTLNREQILFGINQGGVFSDIRVECAKRISELGLDGYAVGGLAVGETHAEMYHILEETVPHLPLDKPTYLMGVGTPENLLEAVDRGVDFFDCVMPARNGRHGNVYTNRGKLNLWNLKHREDDRPISPECGCPVCQAHSRAYIRHLFKAGEMLALRLCVLHNLYFYNNLMKEMRDALDDGRFAAYKRMRLGTLSGGEIEHYA